MKTSFTTFGTAALLLCMVLTSTLAHAQGSWSSASSEAFTPRLLAGSGEVDGKIYVFGGLTLGELVIDTLEVYDPSTDSWSAPVTEGTFTARANLASAVVDGKIYAIGGGIAVGNTPAALDLVEVFEPASNSWSTPATTGTYTARSGHASAVVDGKIYLFGGKDGSTYITAVDVFDTQTNTWSTPVVTGTFTPRDFLTASAINGKIYTFGGHDGMTNLDAFEVFDPVTNTWSTPLVSGSPTARRGAASIALDGKLFTIGGFDDAILNTVEVFDPSTNAWTTPITSGDFTPRFAPALAVAVGKLYAIGGRGADFKATNRNEVFTLEGSSIMEDRRSPGYVISPNPTKGILTVRGGEEGNMHVTISNLLGQQLLQIDQPHSAEFSIDLSGLPSGAYLARFVSSGSSTTKIFVKD